MGIGGAVGVALYTWGGDFTWQLRGNRDSCLGRLVPTQALGEDDARQVRHPLISPSSQ